MFETVGVNLFVLPQWLDKLPYHVKGCIIVLLALHVLVVFGGIYLGIRSAKSEGGAGVKPPFSQDFKTKNQ